MRLPEYDLKLAQEAVWASVYAAAFVLVEALASLNNLEDPATWAKALGLAMLRAGAGAMLAIMTARRRAV